MRSSPWIRGAPQVGFSATIRKINSRTSFGVHFLPTCLRTLEISRQYIRKPVRCQRTTVSGVTMTRECFQAPQTPRANIPRRACRRGRGSGEDVYASTRRVVDAKRDSQEGDFAAHERSGPAFRSRARRSETWSGFITEWRWDGSSYVINFTACWSFGEPQLTVARNFNSSTRVP